VVRQPILDEKLELLEPKQPETVRETMLQLAPDLIIQLAMDDRQSVYDIVHSRSPTDGSSIGSTMMEKRSLPPEPAPG
jgi:hypothetical protein